MKNSKKQCLKSLSVFLLSTLLMMLMPDLGVFATERLVVSSITANCTVKDSGETAESFDLVVEGDLDLTTIKAEDFIVENAVINHGGVVGKIKVKEIIVNGKILTLKVDDFLLVKSPKLKITCTVNDGLSFNFDDITKISSPVADKFESKEYNGLNYKLFSPDDDKALPLVIWMHGSGDTGLQLRTAKNGTMFAEDENQAKNPCYVLAPQSDDSLTEKRWSDKELENIIAVVNKLIEEGKVDKNRVYVTGHSMGGQGTWNLLRKAPELFAAAITMAPRVIAEQAELDDLTMLKDLPVWLFHATSDPINKVEGSRDRYNKLVELGNKNVKYTEVSDDEMKSFGLGYGSPFEYHATNVVMANTPGVMEWLFAQSKSQDTEIQGITANCTVMDSGETVHSFDIAVEGDGDLTTIKPEDFTVENAVINHGGVKGNIKIKEVKVEGNKISLIVDDFLLVKSPELKISCSTNEALSFGFNDITKISSPVADKFESKEYNGLNYKLFSPDADKALPLVIWMHGSGDTGLQLRTAKNATMFAEDENQEKNPSYVLAPQSDDSLTEKRWSDKELENIIAVVNKLIEEGKVDKNRVYVTGHSMGGQGTWNLLRKAPELFAAAITMAPRVIAEQAELDDLAMLKDLPVWLFHATSDPINKVEGSRDRYNKLVELGNKNVKYTEVSDDEMKSFGLGYGSPFEYHATNVVMANTPGVMEWLFAQSKAKKTEEPNQEDKPSIDVDGGAGNTDKDTSDTEENEKDGKGDKLPNTGAPVSSLMLILSGAMAIGAGRKLLINKKIK